MPHHREIFFTTCTKGDAGEVDRLVRQTGGDVLSEVDAHGRTPLHIAALHGHEGVARVLLREGASPAAADSLHLLPHHLAFDAQHNSLGVFLRDSLRERVVSQSAGNPYRSVRGPHRDENDSLYEEVGTIASDDFHSAGTPQSNFLDPPPEGQVYFVVTTPGRPGLRIALYPDDTLLAIPQATGLGREEPHYLQFQSQRLVLRDLVEDCAFPFSSQAAPLAVEQRPERVYLHVISTDNVSHHIRIATDQPLSKLLNAPGLSPQTMSTTTLWWKDEPLDWRQAPGIYNIPCNLAHPPVLKIRANPSGELASFRSSRRR